MEDIWIIPVLLCLIIILLSFALLLKQSIVKEEERKLREYREKIIERKIKDKMCKLKGEQINENCRKETGT